MALSRQSVLATVKAVRSDETHTTGIGFKPEKDSGLPSIQLAFPFSVPDCTDDELAKLASSGGVVVRTSQTLVKIDGVGRTDRKDAIELATGRAAMEYVANITSAKLPALPAAK